MAKRRCSIIENEVPCTRPVLARNLCSMHYQRKWRTGGTTRTVADYASNPTCKTEGCDAPARGRGWCVACYHGWERHGDPTWRPRSDLDRFYGWVDKDGPNGCWLWRGSTTNGYGRFSVGNRGHFAHKWIWEQANGQVAEGKQIDHECHTNDPSCTLGELCPHRRCVRLEHLTVVTPKQNTQRGRNTLTTHCRAGHLLAEAGMYVYPNGKRQCRACRKGYARKA